MIKAEKILDVRGEICPYPMMIANKELDSNPDINSFEIIFIVTIISSKKIIFFV